MQKNALLPSLGLTMMLFACAAKPQETMTEHKGESLKIGIRTQEFHNSGIKNIDICAMPLSAKFFPKDEGRCFLKGYDFSDLSVEWKSPQQIDISFRCGRVSSFKNFAIVPYRNDQSIQVHATLTDNCDHAKTS